MLDPDKVLVRRAAIRRRVRPRVVVEEFVLKELWRDAGDGERTVVAVPELDAGGSVGPFDTSVPLGAPRRQDFERDAQGLAGTLEVGHELAAAVDPDGGDGERHGLDHGEREAPGVAGGGAGETVVTPCIPHTAGERMAHKKGTTQRRSWTKELVAGRAAP